jgi:sortase A
MTMRSINRQTLLGLTLITFGLALLLGPLAFVEITNQRATDRADEIRQSIERSWSNPPAERRLAELDDAALLYVPKLGIFGVPIVDGVDAESLASGVGRYPGVPRAGQPGNLALAGHRTAHGEPFADIDDLEVGDVVLVRTEHSTFRYRLLRDTVVTPDQTWVLGDVSERLGVPANSPLISLITCSPKWSTEKRWVWWGALIDERPA